VPGTPKVVEHAPQPYVAIKAFVTMQTLGHVLPPLHLEVRAWLDRAGVPTRASSRHGRMVYPTQFPAS
jgi:hypothetical protein